MGASGISKVFPGTLSEAELKAKFALLHEESLHEDGHSAYSGGWGTLRGVTVVRTAPLASEDEALRYILDHAEKWSHALAVRFRRVTQVQRKAPTFAGKPRTYCPGCLEKYVCVTVQYRDEYRSGAVSNFTRVIVPADQLSPAQQEAVREAAQAYWNADVAVAQLEAEQHKALMSISLRADDYVAWLATKPDWAALKKAHTELTRAVRVAVKAKKALDALEAKLAPELLVVEDKDEGEFWLLGGWAAS